MMCDENENETNNILHSTYSAKTHIRVTVQRADNNIICLMPLFRIKHQLCYCSYIIVHYSTLYIILNMNSIPFRGKTVFIYDLNARQIIIEKYLRIIDRTYI